MKKIIPWWLVLDLRVILMFLIITICVATFSLATSLSPLYGTTLIALSSSVLFYCGVRYFKMSGTTVQLPEDTTGQSDEFFTQCVLWLCGLPMLGTVPLALTDFLKISETVFLFGSLSGLCALFNIMVLALYFTFHCILADDARGWKGDVV